MPPRPSVPCAVLSLKTEISPSTPSGLCTRRVLSVLLYGSGCWTPLRRHLKRLNAFHHHCVRTILGITSSQQWEMRITSASTREQWGDMETIATKVAKRRMEWLGHSARMSNARLCCLVGCPKPAQPVGLGDGEMWSAMT